MFVEAPANICVLSGPDYRYTFANPAYQQLFEGRQLLGLPIAEALPEVIDQDIVGWLNHVYQTGQTHYGNEVCLHLTTPGGEQRVAYFNFTYQRFEETEGQAGILVFAYDVTQLVQARQALENLPGASLSTQ
jgi:PAS domain-containing protein